MCSINATNSCGSKDNSCGIGCDRDKRWQETQPVASSGRDTQVTITGKSCPKNCNGTKNDYYNSNSNNNNNNYYNSKKGDYYNSKKDDNSKGDYSNKNYKNDGNNTYYNNNNKDACAGKGSCGSKSGYDNTSDYAKVPVYGEKTKCAPDAAKTWPPQTTTDTYKYAKPDDTTCNKYANDKNKKCEAKYNAKDGSYFKNEAKL